jgi:hypothetical protein
MWRNNLQEGLYLSEILYFYEAVTAGKSFCQVLLKKVCNTR